MSGLAVLKLGGASALASARQVADRAAVGPVVVVHGGGPQISARMRERGVEPRFSGGRRVTDEAALACVVAALADVSAELCGALAAAGLDPAPLVGGVVRARHVPELGLVGEPVAADLAAVRTALDRGAVPVVAPLGVGEGGEGLLNVNADDAAACIAASLGAAELAFLSDVPGVLGADGLPIARVAASRPPAAAVGGMAAKLEAAGAALAGGVARVSIGGAAGTQVVP